MIVLTGLGNPGPRYEFTRHNAGFLILDLLANQAGVQFESKPFKKGLSTRARLLGQDCLLVKPQTYMNLSGDSVREVLQFYKLPLESLVVLHDDIDVPPLKVKTRTGGSHGGHNGIRSIIETFSSDRFHRVKLGLGKSPYPGGDSATWVLGTFTETELLALKGPMFDEVLLRLEGIFRAISTDRS